MGGRGPEATKKNGRQRVIGAEVSMRAEKHSNGHKVDAMCAKRIRGAQKAIEVVRPDIISNK